MRKFKIALIALVMLSILSDILFIHISFEQIPRSFNSFISFLSPRYWSSLTQYYILSDLIIKSFNILFILLGVFGLYKYIKSDIANMSLLLYLNYRIIFSLIMNTIGLIYFPNYYKSLSFVNQIGAYFNMAMPFVFFTLLYLTDYLKVIFQPNYRQEFDKSKMLFPRLLNIAIDSLIILIVFLSIGTMLEGLKINLLIGLNAVFVIYILISIIYFKNTIATIITKNNFYHLCRWDKTTANTSSKVSGFK